MAAEVILTLALLTQPVDALAHCETRRAENLAHALEWEHRAEQGQIDLVACLDRLAVRTATPTPAVVEFRAVESEWTAPKLVLGGVLVFCTGVAVGLLTALALR